LRERPECLVDAAVLKPASVRHTLSDGVVVNLSWGRAPDASYYVVEVRPERWCTDSGSA
jgi:hypothetical protein